MVRKWAKRTLAILLSASVIGSNTQFVRAVETDSLKTENQNENIAVDEAVGGAEVEEDISDNLEDQIDSDEKTDESSAESEKTEPEHEVSNDLESQDINEDDPEVGDRANSWRYEDGKPVGQRLRSSQYATWPTDIPGTTAYGIDVSAHQGVIDWSAVKAAGVDYAIIRCGYGMDQTDQDDAYWYANADACEDNDIPFGTYLYSYADSVERAQSEAEHVLRLVEGYDLSYPIYYDLEESSVREKLSTAEIADIAETFCDIIEEAGYEVAIYANKDWFTNYLTDSRFENWDKWVAQYNTTCTYEGEYNMWQCSSEGKVDGIEGNVDLNIDFGASIGGRRIVMEGGNIYGYDGANKLYGAQKILDHWYYFDESNDGAAYIGWRTDGDKTYYYDEEGRLAQGAKKIGSCWYYFSGNGNMYKGWRTDGDKTYYYDEEGRLAQGAKKIGSYWYYFSGNGNMYKGWRTDGDKTYYYDEEGRLAQGAKKIGSYWYYFSGNGNMYTGWRTDGDKTYYYDEEGRLAQGAKKIGSYWYYFSGNGNMYTGWRTDGDKTYYYNEDGRLAQKATLIDGIWYNFKSNGELIN